MPSIGYLCVASFYLVIFLPCHWKVTFSGTKKIIEPQFSTYRHRTGFIVKRKQVRISPCLSFPLNWLFFFILILKVAYFGTKKYVILKKISKIYFWFFFKKPALRSTYICTIFNDNFKFKLSLKLNGQLSFIAVPPNAFLFSITRFLYGWQKIFTNKIIFLKHVLHVLFISFFSKMYNKKLVFIIQAWPVHEHDQSTSMTSSRLVACSRPLAPRRVPASCDTVTQSLSIEQLVIEFIWTKKFCTQLFDMKFHRGGTEC